MPENPAHPPESATGAPTPPAAAPAAAPIPPEVLKSAFNAFKKRWKLTRLDQESRIGRSPLSGRQSSIAGIVPPDQFPRAVWEELAKQGKLKHGGQGFYSLP